VPVAGLSLQEITRPLDDVLKGRTERNLGADLLTDLVQRPRLVTCARGPLVFLQAGRISLNEVARRPISSLESDRDLNGTLAGSE